MMQVLFENSTDCIKMLDFDGRILDINASGLRLLQVDDLTTVLGRHWLSVRPDYPYLPEAEPAMEAARQGRQSRFSAAWTTPNGSVRWWDIMVSPIPGIDGNPRQILVISHDITAEHEGAAQTALLIQELGHRVKNAYAMAGAIVAQTLRGSDSVRSAKETLGRRLSAMARAHDLLIDRDWAGTDITVLLATVLELHQDADKPGQFTTEGPAFALSAAGALGLCLILHELAANAVRHGALSAPEGRVQIVWSVDEKAYFHLAWREAGGPEVQAPLRRGFGTRLIEESVPSRFGGIARLNYAASGLQFEMKALAARLVPTA